MTTHSNAIISFSAFSLLKLTITSINLLNETDSQIALLPIHNQTVDYITDNIISASMLLALWLLSFAIAKIYTHDLYLNQCSFKKDRVVLITISLLMTIIIMRKSVIVIIIIIL